MKNGNGLENIPDFQKKSKLNDMLIRKRQQRMTVLQANAITA